LEQSQKHSVLLFNHWGRHYAQVIDADATELPPTERGGLIGEIMVTLDPRFVDDALLQRALSGEAGWSTAEILRAQALALLSQNSGCASDPCGSWLASDGVLSDSANIKQAEHLLQQALTTSRTQGALAWELRSATSLAQLWHRQSRGHQALNLLGPVVEQFSEGFATPDLSRTRLLIDALSEDVRA
jgi:hypothetical protein